MNYTAATHIKTVRDVKAFFNHLAFDRNLSFHPDDDFATYVHYLSNRPVFKEDEIKMYNRLMNESFVACEKADYDIYEIGLQVMRKVLAN